MPNALYTPTQIDIPGAIGTGLRNAGSLMELQKEKKRMADEEALNNALAQRLPEFTSGGKTDYAGMGNALSQDLASQGQGAVALQVKEAMGKMSAEQLKQAKERMDLFSGIAGDAVRRYDSLIRSGQAKTPEEAAAMMQPYHDEAKRVAAQYGIELSPNFKPANYAQFLKESAIHNTILEQALATRLGIEEKKVKVAEDKVKQGKGGSKTAFVQIADWLRNNITTNDEKTGKPRKLSAAEAQFQAEKIMSKGKFNEQAAAVTLKKSGMSQDRITEFLDFAKGLGSQAEAGAKSIGEASEAGKTQPPKGAVQVFKDGKPRTSDGKNVWELPTKPGEKKKYWLQSQSEPVNLAMNAENVPLGSGRADYAQDFYKLQNEWQKALMNEDFERADQIKKQMNELENSRRNVG